MWLKRFTHYLIKNRWAALALTFFITFVPVIGTLGILLAALVTLIKGAVEGLFFTLAATLPYLISFYLTGTHDAATLPIVLWAAVGVAVFSNVLTYVFAVMLRRQTSWSSILQIAALLGVLVISVVHMAYPGVEDWWATQLQSYYTQAADAAKLTKETTTKAISTVTAPAIPVQKLSLAKPTSANSLPPNVLESNKSTSETADTGPNQTEIDAIKVTKQYATGLMVAAILFNAILQLIVARWWQSITFMPGLLRKELHSIRLSHLAGLLFILGLGLSYLGNGVVLDIMPVVYLLFGAAGLSLIHFIFGEKKSSSTWFWLAIFYLLFIFLLPTSMIFVAMLALLDIWFDVRKRIKKV